MHLLVNLMAGLVACSPGTGEIKAAANLNKSEISPQTAC